MIAEQTGFGEPPFRLLFEASPNPYLILRPDKVFTIVAVNDAYLAATGTQRANIVGRGLFEVFPDNPDDHSGSGVGDLRSSLQRVISDKVRDLMGVQKYDIPRREGEGFEVKYWSPENVPVLGSDGDVAFIIHHVEDITDFVLMRERDSQESAEKIERVTERAEKTEAEVMRRATEVKDANRQIKAAMEKVEAANRAKSVFLANMSHELRTPLNAILGFSRLMRNATDVTAEQVRNLNIIFRSGEHLLNLINNVLDISKIESGRVALEEREFDLHQLLHETQSLTHVQAAEKNLNFNIVLAPDLPRHVSADAGKLRQVLINLVANAIKFTRNGAVVLRAALAKPESPRRARIRFEVEDSGPGIREEDRVRLFSPFVQLARQPLAQAGSGLGLAISKQYVELMGGSIGVSSAPGTGSVFHFEVPVGMIPALSEDGSTTSLNARVAALVPGQERYRLLIAEDQPENRLLLHELLEPLGFEMREAANGLEALALAEQWRPHLVWMDIRMPEMNGLEATRRIKASPAGARTKIIAVTAHALEEERQEILAAGCDDFIRKPYQDADIFEALAKHLGVRFLYTETQAPGADAHELDAAQLKQLPAALLGELREAAVLLDGEHCLDVAARIGRTDARLGLRLRDMVKNLQYRELLALLDSFMERTAA